jgi:hypothetical protein
MHHYAAAVLTVSALPVALMLAHEYTEHRKRKAEARKAAEAEAMMARAIEKAFLNATRRRAAEKQQAQQLAAHRAKLEAIERNYWTNDQ